MTVSRYCGSGGDVKRVSVNELVTVTGISTLPTRPVVNHFGVNYVSTGISPFSHELRFIWSGRQVDRQTDRHRGTQKD